MDINKKVSSQTFCAKDIIILEWHFLKELPQVVYLITRRSEGPQWQLVNLGFNLILPLSQPSKCKQKGWLDPLASISVESPKPFLVFARNIYML